MRTGLLYISCCFIQKNSVVIYSLYYYFVNDEGIVRSNWGLRNLDNFQDCENQLEFFRL